jgi:hypothetical protein
MTDELKPLSKKHQRFVAEYLNCFNGTQAYMKVYPNASPETARANASELLTKTNISAAIDEQKNMVLMQADEAFKNLSDIANSNMGVFWKVQDEWMFNPLPEYEILDEKEVKREKEDGTFEKVVAYRVRHVILDMDKVIDPEYSHLIQEFSNSRKSGLSIKTYNRHAANVDILKIHGRFAPDKLDINNPDGSLKPADNTQVLGRINQLLELAKQRKAKDK